jgi:aromatic ring-opening dioxygenase catalytic subunit (LigB family)
MGTLDDDMAQEGDIAKLQENFNEVVEKNIQIDHQRQEIEELKELYTKLKQKRRLDSLRPRTTPKKYKF